MIFGEGNNREAVKIKRIQIPIVFETGVTNYNRFYLPEIPEINKGKVVGIQAFFCIGAAGQAKAVPVPVINTTANNLGINFPTALGKYATLNLLDSDDKLIIENFPLMQLSGFNAPSIAGSTQKVIPFDIKINTRRSYIYYFRPTTTQTGTLFVNLSFFYID